MSFTEGQHTYVVNRSTQTANTRSGQQDSKMSRDHLKGSSKLNKARAGTIAKCGILHPSPDNSSMQNLSSPSPSNRLPEISNTP